MTDYPGSFVWFELMTTDTAAAAAFYREVVGWETEEASTPRLPYSHFTIGKTPVCGLMELPEEGRRMGARPQWMGYIGVADVGATVGRAKRLGGTVYVPPTQTNIGLIAVMADPKMAAFGVVHGLLTGQKSPAEMAQLGRIGWHELLADDWQKEFAFYSEIFGWQKVDSEINPIDPYQAFSTGGKVIGGMFSKPADDPAPFWLFYFNVEDIDAAAERVKACGGKTSHAPLELPGGISIVRCFDPQGATFALHGKMAYADAVGWSTQWQGFSSRGRLVAPKSAKPPSARKSER